MSTSKVSKYHDPYTQFHCICSTKQDVGEEQADGSHSKKTHSGRTSTNAWCVDECYKDPIAQRVMQRIENITGVPETNSENLQMLKYDETQFYQTHSKYLQCGCAILGERDRFGCKGYELGSQFLNWFCVCR